MRPSEAGSEAAVARRVREQRDQDRHHRPAECRQEHAAERADGYSRAIVSPIAGTTRDAVDEVVERDGHAFRFVDTAGIRRKGKTKLMAEKLSRDHGAEAS